MLSRDSISTSPGQRKRNCKIYLYQLKSKRATPFHWWWTVHNMANLDKLLNQLKTSPRKKTLRIFCTGITPSANSTSSVMGFLNPSCYPDPPTPPWGVAYASGTGAWVRGGESDDASPPYPVASYSIYTSSSSYPTPQAPSSYPSSVHLPSS